MITNMSNYIVGKTLVTKIATFLGTATPSNLFHVLHVLVV
jgi:hypothetical protein